MLDKLCTVSSFIDIKVLRPSEKGRDLKWTISAPPSDWTEHQQIVRPGILHE